MLRRCFEWHFAFSLSPDHWKHKSATAADLWYLQIHYTKNFSAFAKSSGQSSCVLLTAHAALRVSPWKKSPILPNIFNYLIEDHHRAALGGVRGGEAKRDFFIPSAAERNESHFP